MANTIDVAFIKQFESRFTWLISVWVPNCEHCAYGKQCDWPDCSFQKIGTGSASTKSRNGNVTPMELAHTKWKQP